MNKNVLILILVATLAAAGIVGWILWRDAGGGDAGPVSPAQAATYQSGPFRLSVAVSPETPVVGKNQLSIRLEDTDGNPVSGARIKAVATMPAMGSMPAMHAPADLEETKPGHYVGPFNLSMSGA